MTATGTDTRLVVVRTETIHYSRAFTRDELADIFAAELAEDGRTAEDIDADYLALLLAGGAFGASADRVNALVERHGDVVDSTITVTEEVLP